MSQTANLMLPYLAAGQAQKHVTVNESLRRLDAIVQLAVVSATVTAQPGSPADGAAWIVPSGKTGAQWSAFTNWSLGYYRDGAWEQITPREGWLAWVKDDGEFLHFDGAGWTALPSGGGGSYTTEEAQDAAAALFTPDDGDIDFTYNDATPSISAQIKAGAVGTPELADDAVTFDKLLNATGAGFIGATGAGGFSERTPAQVRAAIGLDTTDSPQLAAVNLGHASNTTLAQGSAAGVVAVEGVDLVDVSRAQTLTNKTLTAPVIATISNTGTLTLPTSTDTLVGRATADTLTNKTLTSPTINGAALSGTLSGAHTLSGLTTFSAGADMTPASTPSTTAVGYLGAPQNSQSAAYTLVMADAGKSLFHPPADTTARTWTIPANASVAFPTGTVIVIRNGNGAGVITLGITSDTLRWGSSTGSRSLAANAMCTLYKESATVWVLEGSGVT